MRGVGLVVLTACRLHFDDHPDADARPLDSPDSVDAAMPCPADAILCDDFELGNLSRWTGTRPATSSVVVDGDLPHLGSFALDSRVAPAGGNGGEAFVYLTLAPYDQLAIRAWAYLPDPIESFQGVIYLVDLPQEQHYLEVSTDIPVWTIAGDDGSTLRDYPTNVTVERATWTCLELDLDLTAHHLQLFIGAAVALDSTIFDASPMFGTLGIGTTRANADGFHDYIDDVVIATSHVGCD
jgi:hypothetical protein